MKQWLFGRVELKQMHNNVCIDEWTMNSSSTTLEAAPIDTCHGRTSMQQCGSLAYSDEMMLAKASKMLVDDGTMDNSTSSLKIFRKSFK